LIFVNLKDLNKPHCYSLRSQAKNLDVALENTCKLFCQALKCGFL